MNPQDLKRLIAGFLVFSVIASIATFISLNFIGTAPQQQAVDVEGENPLTTVSKNAFVEKLPGNSGQTANSTTGQSGAGANAYVSSNLTRNLAGVFASQMIDNNPSGPQLDENGNPTVLNLPGEDKTAEMIKQALSKSGFEFDDRISVPARKIANSFGPDDVSVYLKNVYGIMNQVSSSTNSSLAGTRIPTADDLILSELTLEAALTKLSSLSVPKPFAEVHTMLLRLFSNQKNIFSAVADYQTDPVKTMLALQNENEIINRDLARAKDAISKVDQNALSSNSTEWQNFYSGIFGVQKAYAILGFGDIVFDPAAFGNTLATVSNLISTNLSDIAKWAYDTALSIAVNILIDEFQNQVVNWIAGGGQPKFITDWGGFLRNVGDKVAGQIIYGVAPYLCSGLGPLIRVALLPVPYANTNVRCTLSQVSNNINNFFNRFQNGSWYAYGYAMQPNNNYFGNLILINDNLMREKSKAEDAAKNEATAGKGFLSIKKCTKYAVDEDNNPTTTCEPGFEVITTPGDTVGENLRVSLGWKGNQIVTAKRFESLVAAIVNASINRIIKEGLSSLTAAMNPPAPSFTGATPAGVTNPGSLTPIINQVSNVINSLSQIGVFQNIQTIIDSDRQWLTLKDSAIAALGQLPNTCSNLSDQASQRINDLNSLAPTVQSELTNASSLSDLKAAVSSASSPSDLKNILTTLQAIDIVKVRDTATAAQARPVSLQYFISVAQNASANDGCPSTLPAIDATPPDSSSSGD